MNIDLLGHWRGGAVNDAAMEAIREHGTQAINNIDIGPLEGLYGANTDLVKSRIRTIQQQAINDDPMLQALGVRAGLPVFGNSGGMADFGETAVGFAARANQQIKENAEIDRQRLRTEGIQDQNRAQGFQMQILGEQGRQQDSRLAAQLASQTNNLKAQMANNNAQFAFTSKENNLNRRHERELADGRNDLSLQISLMQNDLADKRMQYDRETRRMDRRDKYIAQLMQGIGQLGGAFAL